jgi:hypothetical protein
MQHEFPAKSKGAKKNKLADLVLDNLVGIIPVI